MKPIFSLFIAGLLISATISAEDPLPPGVNSIKAVVKDNAITLFAEFSMPSDQELQAASKALRDLFPRSGFCGRCGIPWPITNYHITPFNFHDSNDDQGVSQSGCFCLCEHCWQEFSPDKRLAYYRKNHDRSVADAKRYNVKRDHEGLWEAVKAAVLDGR